jgi:hypothetical protein
MARREINMSKRETTKRKNSKNEKWFDWCKWTIARWTRNGGIHQQW